VTRDRRLRQDYERMLAICRSDEYRNGPAARKREVLWEAVSREPFDPLPRMFASRIMTYIRLANRRGLRQAFHVTEDVRPPRRKAFHPFGTVAQVRLEPVAGHPYTGLLQSGALGFARLSLARDPRTYSPSAAFKFFIDGRPSEHLVLDQSIDEQTSRDFFERAPTNITSWPQRGKLKYGWYVLNWWLSPIADPLHQYLDNLAMFTSDGAPVAEPRVAYRISFYAPPELHTTPDARSDFRAMAARIPVGAVLYQVYVTGSPGEEQQTHVGTIITESPFVASAFGDQILSLRHVYQRGAQQQTAAVR
jgi:hypothetical protein